jgi:ribose 1,5-bisphosphokinase
MTGDRREGSLWLLVGPSGAGKDSLLGALAPHLSLEDATVIARRYITRPFDAIGEAHLPVDTVMFERLRRAGAFALHWRSHGQCYGLGAEVTTWLDAGLVVLANGSRSALAEARDVFGERLVVVHVTASLETLAARLRARGREDAHAIANRLALVGDRDAGLAADLVIHNDGPLEEAVTALRSALRGRDGARV